MSRSAFRRGALLCHFPLISPYGTYIFELLDKLAELLDHLRHEDDVHLVGEVGGIHGVDQQAPSHGHHAALVQRHLQQEGTENKGNKSEVRTKGNSDRESKREKKR